MLLRIPGKVFGFEEFAKLGPMCHSSLLLNKLYNPQNELFVAITIRYHNAVVVAADGFGVGAGAIGCVGSFGRRIAVGIVTGVVERFVVTVVSCHGVDRVVGIAAYGFVTIVVFVIFYICTVERDIIIILWL